MQFVDEAVIEIASGDGGAGIVSFRREAHVALGGPDGGDGGRGGDVVVEATTGVVTLLDHRYRRFYRAKAGTRGGAKRCTGASADALVIPVPIGTLVLDEATGEILADLTVAGQRTVVAKGGRGGQGNARFQTSTRRTPRFAQDGEPGASRTLRLSLKLVADVGLVGLPNAGKSTFIRATTNSQARVGAYPFTTLVPNLGVYRRGEREVVIADIPGLIAGASSGAGLGDRFLKHLERTKVLIHLVSLSPDAVDPLVAYDTIVTELKQRSATLAKRPTVVVLNKIDLIPDPDELALWRDEFATLGVTIRFASGLAGDRVHDVMNEVLSLMDRVEAPSEPKPWSPI